MGDVIAVDFRNKARLKPRAAVMIDPSIMQVFKEILSRHGCGADEIDDIVLGVTDYNHYLTLDHQRRHIADVFITNTQHLQ